LSVRSSSDVFRAIRTEVFGDTQMRFGKRLGLTRETILRLEGLKEGHHVSFKHLYWLRKLPAPAGKTEQLQGLLAELETAIGRELRANAADQPANPSAISEDLEAAQAHLTGLSEDAARRAEAAAQRAEQLQREENARRDEDARQREEVLRRAEAVVLRTEQLQREEEARRAEEALRSAREAEEAARREKQARATSRRRGRRLVFATLAASAAFGALSGGLLHELAHEPQDARAREQVAASPQRPEWNVEPDTEPAPLPEEVTSIGLDAGTELAQVFKAALPMPKGGLPDQATAPCPDSIEEHHGYCWLRVPLNAAQVRDGVCESETLYEPSAGWCRAHRAGYQPFRRPGRRNNVVDP